MPADHLVRDSRSNESRTDDLFEYHIRREGLFAFQPNGRKEEVVVAGVVRDTLLSVEVLDVGGMERNRLAAGFGLRVSEVITDARANHVDLHQAWINVAAKAADFSSSNKDGREVVAARR